ncbi:hypothetical protein A2686_02610 [Candidatus Woesebacteria bacterium RIFCSPHIGHO2_01_FULL_38_10]|uniref:Uncharacterized protein n=1 Tax=Candidatus Woesebacteria bacterium RIFCSPLOWO2_01_FULL_39_10b TaxID=1802517 RepID=A0A1F8B949_9BACT|nr:MAG: hypothetical protein A2686_02610 [Candidatus Woesebacteria bacterium RIFCSPHIGHO2_01_FULL_38_10]OGM60460.1 MAG: hypothetical protein A2892_00300 [Candidatus Woesebacteria bacterium RIFCSPLOWO2_01_FULL_39_10b]
MVERGRKSRFDDQAQEVLKALEEDQAATVFVPIDPSGLVRLGSVRDGIVKRLERTYGVKVVTRQEPVDGGRKLHFSQSE